MKKNKLRLPPGTPAGGFRTIVADPNWLYQNFGQKKHGAARAHYAGSTIEELGRIPLLRFAARDATLLMWQSLSKLGEGIDLGRAWGCHDVTSWPWVKTVPSKAELAQGIGFWSYAAAELLVAWRRGKAKGPVQTSKNKPIGLLCGPRETPVFYSRRGPHSRKPLALIEWIENSFPGPYLELFATGARPGWTTWGHCTGWHLCEEGVIPLDEARARGLVKDPEPQKPGKSKRRRRAG